MFLEQFAGQESIVKDKAKKVKKEYSAGFRNYYGGQSKVSSEPDTADNNEDDLMFEQLKIGNLKELYMQSLPQIDNTKQIVEEQRKAIERLTSLKKKEVEKENENEEVDKEKKKQMQQKFMKTYHRMEGYSQKADRRLFKNQFQKIKERLKEIFNKYSKKGQFETVIVEFVLSFSSVYKEKQKINSDVLALDFQNFVIKYNDKQRQKIASLSIRAPQFRELTLKNLFLFGFFDSEKKGERIMNFQNLKDSMRKSDQFEKQFFIPIQLQNKTITIPYEPQTKHKNDTVVKEVNKDQQLQRSQNIYKFHANALPKTTYEKPKERPKSQMAKTQPKPFNLTVTNTNIPKLQDFYNWQRNFKASEVPKTTYKPRVISTNNEDERKKRALQLLHSSKYPQSMKYLNNYNELWQQKNGELLKKYTKQKVRQETKNIPNFDAIHRRLIENMQNCRVENRPLTQPEPFNLSKPRQRQQKIENHNNYIVEQYEQQEEQFNFAEHHKEVKVKPRSTLKFDTYVDFRKKQKQEKLQVQEKKVKQQKKKDRTQYKQILKDRLYGEITHSSNKNSYPTKLEQNSVKVDLEKIYKVQPLLIERESAKNKKQMSVTTNKWQPII